MGSATAGFDSGTTGVGLDTGSGVVGLGVCSSATGLDSAILSSALAFSCAACLALITAIESFCGSILL